MIPVLGGAAVEIFTSVGKPPAQRRQATWFNALAKEVEQLEKRGKVSAKRLQAHEAFISSAMQAASQTYEQEKLDALRNAVLNAVMQGRPEDSEREVFLNFVDIFSVCHLRVLRSLAVDDKREGRPATSVKDIVELVRKLLPDLRNQRSLVRVVVDDLCRHGLLYWNGGATITYIPRGAKQVSELGYEFLRFITEPDDVTE